MVLIPVLDDGRVVLIRQYRHSVKRVLWEFPAGSIDPGEALNDHFSSEVEIDPNRYTLAEKLERYETLRQKLRTAP